MLDGEKSMQRVFGSRFFFLISLVLQSKSAMEQRSGDSKSRKKKVDCGETLDFVSF